MWVSKPLLLIIVTFFIFFYSICQAQTIKVSNYGIKNDAKAIYKAINSKNDTIIIDYKSKPWLVEPMRFEGLYNKVILLEKGVELQAKKGCFKNNSDALWTFTDCQNIRILGNNDTKFCMNKEEYLTGEWRHGISLRGVKNFEISDLSIANTGGDGIYIAGSKNNRSCQDISISNVESLNNKRQGISIISGENVIIKNSLFVNTKGTLPGAGLDIEPNKELDVIKNIFIDSCVFENNYGAGIVVGLRKLTKTSTPVSIAFNNCILRNNHSVNNKKVAAEIIIGSNADNPVGGVLKFNNLYVENSNWGLLYTRKQSKAFAVEFNNCTIKNVSQKSDAPLLYFEVPNYYDTKGALGGVSFNNLIIYNETELDLLLVRGSRLGTLKAFENVKINVYQKGLSLEPIKYINYSSNNNKNVAIKISKIHKYKN